MGSESLPLGLVVANVAGAVVFAYVVRRQFPEMRWALRLGVPSTLFRYSLPLGFSEVVVSFLLRTDLWMVLVLLGPADAGVYAVMVTISNGLRTIRQSYNPILLPVVAGMETARLKTDLKAVYSYCVAMVTLIQLAIGGFIVLFPEETMLLAGRSFVIKPEVLGILLFGNLMSGMFGLSAAVINGLGKSRFMLMLNAVSLAFALVANYLLIPPLGILGAALSTVLFQVMHATWMNVYLVRMGLWPYKRSLLVQGGFILALLAVYIGLNTVLSLEPWQKIVGYAVFLAALFVTLKAQGLVIRRPVET
jgi:O-antigen/teichoic acid export membrane protein